MYSRRDYSPSRAPIVAGGGAGGGTCEDHRMDGNAKGVLFSASPDYVGAAVAEITIDLKAIARTMSVTPMM